MFQKKKEPQVIFHILLYVEILYTYRSCRYSTMETSSSLSSLLSASKSYSLCFILRIRRRSRYIFRDNGIHIYLNIEYLTTIHRLFRCYFCDIDHNTFCGLLNDVAYLFLKLRLLCFLTTSIDETFNNIVPIVDAMKAPTPAIAYRADSSWSFIISDIGNAIIY